MSSLNKSSNFFILVSSFFFLVLLGKPCKAHLSPTFYGDTCPDALQTIKTVVMDAISLESRMAASIIRLHFHDCFVQGCDASVLLDENATVTSERNSFGNIQSLRGFEVIDAAKAQVEKLCAGVVSCADILAVAARDASVAVGGPSWTVKQGRRDSTNASVALANSDLPSFFDSLDQLIPRFAKMGLNEREMVALTGAHSIGRVQCFKFRYRIMSNRSIIDPTFAKQSMHNCPIEGGNLNLTPLDFVTPDVLDNTYFKNLVRKKGLLHADQALFSGGTTDKLVLEYSTNASLFMSDFAFGMAKMGEIEPLTGENGVIRKTCSSLN